MVCSVFFVLYNSTSLFFPPKFCPAQISVTSETMVLQFDDMINKDTKVCNKGSKTSTLDPKAGS